jgi:glucosamine--fructose-6-phosphate aminotransferase (isomerizing)
MMPDVEPLSANRGYLRRDMAARWGRLLDFLLDGKIIMCGIIGIIGKTPVTPLLVEALKRLEYRGYDSAGVATLINGHIERRRAEGKLFNLEAKLAAEPLAGIIGIGHTRWATPTAWPSCTTASSRISRS